MPILRKSCFFKISRIWIKFTGNPLIFSKKLYMTLIKEIIMENNFYLTKNCVSCMWGTTFISRKSLYLQKCGWNGGIKYFKSFHFLKILRRLWKPHLRHRFKWVLLYSYINFKEKILSRFWENHVFIILLKERVFSRNFVKTVNIFRKLCMALRKQLFLGNNFYLMKKMSIYKNIVARGGQKISCFGNFRKLKRKGGNQINPCHLNKCISLYSYMKFKEKIWAIF